MSYSDDNRKVILDLAVTLDGFIEGKNGEIDWCIMDTEMNFEDFLERIDTIFYGRKSYDIWGNYSPDISASAEDKRIWDLIHHKEKVVFSRTISNNSRVKIVRENILDEVEAIKAKPGKDIWLYGGASLITTFMNLDLIDEYRLSVHPVVLGEGKPMFKDIKQRVNLKLANTKAFSSGVVQLIYYPLHRSSAFWRKK